MASLFHGLGLTDTHDWHLYHGNLLQAEAPGGGLNALWRNALGVNPSHERHGLEQRPSWHRQKAKAWIVNMVWRWRIQEQQIFFRR